MLLWRSLQLFNSMLVWLLVLSANCPFLWHLVWAVCLWFEMFTNLFPVPTWPGFTCRLFNWVLSCFSSVSPMCWEETPANKPVRRQPYTKPTIWFSGQYFLPCSCLPLHQHVHHEMFPQALSWRGLKPIGFVKLVESEACGYKSNTALHHFETGWTTSLFGGSSF